MTLNPKEVDAVSKLDGSQRYQYLVKEIADKMIVWSLRDNEGWIATTVVADDGSEGLPLFTLWPHREYAELCITDDDEIAAGIDFIEFKEVYMPNFVDDGTMLSVFKTPSELAMLVPPTELVYDIDQYRAEWYSDDL